MFVVSCVILPFLLESYRGSLKLVLFFAPFTLAFVQYLYDDSTYIIYLFFPVFFVHFLLMLWYIYVYVKISDLRCTEFAFPAVTWLKLIYFSSTILCNPSWFHHSSYNIP